MREIKFRAMHSDGSFRYKTIPEIWENGYHCATHTVDAPREPGDMLKTAFTPSAKWEQFTGLKDKNGVEIYEGDIIRWTDITERGDTRTETVGTSVVFSLEKYIDAMSWIPKHGDVIGNIHENPELLK